PPRPARQVPRALPRQAIRPGHLRAHELPAIGRSDGRACRCPLLLTVARRGVLCHTCSLPGVLRAGRHIKEANSSLSAHSTSVPAIIETMSTFSNVLDQLRKNQPQGKYGIAFEKLMVNYFRNDPTLRRVRGCGTLHRLEILRRTVRYRH